MMAFSPRPLTISTFQSVTPVVRLHVTARGFISRLWFFDSSNNNNWMQIVHLTFKSTSAADMAPCCWVCLTAKGEWGYTRQTITASYNGDLMGTQRSELWIWFVPVVFFL